MFALSTNKSYTISLLEDLKKLKEDGQKWRNKRKLENATFLIVPFVQSFITLQTVVLKAAKLKTLALSSEKKVPNETVKKYQMAKEEDLKISQKRPGEFFLMLLRQRGQIFILKETSLGTILNVNSV